MSKQKIILSILVLVLTAFVQLSFAQTFPKSVITQMATRKMRYHHYLWHNVRDRWNSFPNATKAAFTSIGWAPTRPSRTADGSIILDNGSGEDFLCMHRNMIATANSIIATNKDPYGKIKGWTKLPAPGDKSFPVPAPYVVTGDASSTNSSNTRKTDAFYRDFIVPNEKLFTDPVQLKKMSLGEFGARIEVTVHNFLHMRFSDKCPYGYRPGSGGLIPNVSKTWDDARYNWLGDTYSSHVNPLFWSIHGWVDDRIEDWRKAHGLATIPWSKTWNGGPTDSLPGMSSSSMASMAMSSGGMSTSSIKLASGRVAILTFGPMLMLDMASNNVGDVMQQALDILSKSGVQETSFADDVAVAPWDSNAEPVDPADPVDPTPPVTPPVIPVIPVIPIPVKPVKPVIPVIPSLRPPRV